MFVLTAKVSKTKLAAAVTILIAIVVLIVIVSAARSQKAPETAANADTNDARVKFLAQFGWDVNADAVQAQAVTVPKETDNEVFARYNELQKSQGYDLSAHAGKKAMRYVYEILNYPDAEAPVYATLFVLDGNVIGGDVTNTAPGGLMHGFAAP